MEGVVLVLLILIILIIFAASIFLWQKISKMSASHQQIESVREAIVAIREGLQFLGKFTQDTLHREVSDRLKEALTSLGRVEQSLRDDSQKLSEHSNRLEILNKMDRDLKSMEDNIQEIVEKITGKHMGKVGEVLIEELLQCIPNTWLERKVKLDKGEVEFALRMPGNFLIPLDSKFITFDHPTQIESIPEKEIISQVRRRANEITKYLSDKRIMGFGIAVVPDAVYIPCRKVVGEIASNRIIIVPYSLLLPFTLSLYLMAQRLNIAKVGESEIQTACVALEQAIKVLKDRKMHITSIQEGCNIAIENMEKALRVIKRDEILLPGEEKTLFSSGQKEA